MSKTPFSMQASDYNKYLASQGADVIAKPFSNAVNYRQFMGTGRDDINDEPLEDMGITKEVIATCVPHARSR